MGFLGAEGADIEGVRAQRRCQRGVIELRIVGQGDDGSAAIELQCRQGIVRPLGRERDVGEALVAGKGGARIDDGDEVSRDCRHARQRLGDMHGADDDAAQPRIEHLDEDRPVGALDSRAAILVHRLADGCESRRVEHEIAYNLGSFDQALTTALEVRRQDGAAPSAACREGFFEQRQLHSTRSTKTWILPPQARPTSQARSLVTPKLRSRGSPSAMVFKPSSITAPSTQPPETEPMKPPPCSSASLAPTARGEEPQVETTVASATPLPAPRQSAACCRISSLSPMLTPRRARQPPHPAGAAPGGSMP